MKLIEPTSYLWQRILKANKIPRDGLIIEVAPGYEPKIGNALGLLRFKGKIFVIDPDEKATNQIQASYRQIMPQATIKIVNKPLQAVGVGTDVPRHADALVASHPFDDMVVYANPENYEHGIKATIQTWKNFIRQARPKCFIASQYPSYTLTIQGLEERQQSGFAILAKLKYFYRDFLKAQPQEPTFGFKGNAKWWIVADFRKAVLVPQPARQLRPDEYEIIYADNISVPVNNFAIKLDRDGPLITYADRQKDKTDIGLSGNLGSGRAVYYGDKFNILGVGKTTLCTSTVPSHSTGQLEMIGAIRRLVLSKWINYFTPRAPEHIALIALKECAKPKWSNNPVPLTLLVRIDNGSLDRPSHIECSPQMKFDFEKTLTEYAKLDAEYFAYRFMLGAWSTGNYSLTGHVIDLESASFVKYRSPYYTSSAKYPHNRFGQESLGFLKILNQLASVKNIETKTIKGRFFEKRRQHLGYCFLKLLGLTVNQAPVFFNQHRDRVLALSDQFEILAKKTGSQKADLNLYYPIAEEDDPALLDMSNLFRNLAGIYRLSNREAVALNYLVRKNKIPRTTKKFIKNLLWLIDILHDEKFLDNQKQWQNRLQLMNRNLPIMFELNSQLKTLVEDYRLQKIAAKTLGQKIKNLCAMPLQSFE